MQKLSGLVCGNLRDSSLNPESVPGADAERSWTGTCELSGKMYNAEKSTVQFVYLTSF